jgi:tRNA(Ile)-lysidine synthase
LQDLCLRTRRGGERLLTGAGHHKDLKHLFQEHGVPPWWRDRLPLLFLRSGAGEELLAVGAIASSPQAEALGLELVWQRAKFATK